MSYSKQAVGAPFNLPDMHYASTQSWLAVERMAAQFRPGLRESAAAALGMRILQDLGMQRIWHPLHVRFGANTLKTFREASTGDPVLGEDDIYFIDIGPVFRGHEGDVGATFTTGRDPAKVACAAAAKTLFDDVAGAWREHGLDGMALYDYAAQRAAAMGWRLNLDVRGHRVCDYPHALYRGGALGDFPALPQAGIWVLEIQIAHPGEVFGAFYEDVLF